MPVMWDRMRTGGPQQRQVSGRFDDDDDRMMMAGLGLHSSSSTSLNRGYSYSIKGGPPPPRPPREYIESQYETAPPVQEPPPRNPRRLASRTSNLRQTSSSHSQHPQQHQHQHQHQPGDHGYPANLASKHSRRYGGGEDISPPSSPEPGYGGADHEQGDVSPIDGDEDGPDFSRFGIGSSRTARTNQPDRHETRESPQHQASTNIPMMRRARRKQSDAALREAHALANQRPSSRQQLHHQHAPRQEDPRWDPLTGERTSSPHGKPSQVKPAEFAHGLGISSHASSAPQRSLPTAIPSFGDRVWRMAKRAGGKENNVDPAAAAFGASSRPGWRGASGRTAIVDPVRDTPEVAPLRIPDKSSRRVISPTSASSPQTGLFGGARRGQTPPVSPPVSETVAGSAPRDTIRKIMPSSQQSPSATQPQPPSPQTYPSPPLSGTLPSGDAPSLAARELARAHISAPSPTSPASPTSNPSLHDNPAMIRRKPPPVHANHLHHESVSSVYSQQSQAPSAPPPHKADATFLAANDPWVQPASRFSVTTYATSAVNTPRESFDDFNHQDRPPMPTLPPGFTESPKVAQQESVIDQRWPKLDGPGANNGQVYASETTGSPVVISLKDQFMSSPFGNSDRESQAARDRKAAAPGPSPAVARARAAASAATERAERRVSTASSINKMLPPAPPEASAGEARDRVGMLNAQLQALGNRRININRSIKQMTELMPTDNLMDSLEVRRKREMEKRKVESLKQELSEVQREEYELGLKLHRAYKRLDKDAQWEPTTLWVRRVTG
ncbi:hypothetical protein B0H66DRAFT_247801 [Apodospora peruviana]|uniref:Uncharacterized protein n=1 Tax=Apodospora peruviana TaxID=516989 RepID=A0AAE0I5T6_9PEZI|nr:hypothetical protein B0H66DRAFT_247801 [Apodospora peruviana]